MGIIEKLSKLQNPYIQDRNDRKKFDQLTQFVADVLGKPEAKLDIPHSVDKIILNSDGKELPLESVGFGIHQLIVMAAHCIMRDEEIICIEEPEAFLHPTMLKKFIQYLLERTSNQYFISSHSSTMIDFPGARIFEVTNTGKASKAKLINGSQDKYKMARQLGYSPSDLL